MKYKNNIYKYLLILLIGVICMFLVYFVNSNDHDKTIKDNKKTTSKTTIKISDSDNNIDITSLFNKYNIFNNWLDIYVNSNIDNNFYNNNAGLFDFKYSYFYDSSVTSNSISDGMKFILSVGNIYLKKSPTDTNFSFKDGEELSIKEIDDESIRLFGTTINFDKITDSDNNIFASIRGYSFKYVSSKNIIIASNDSIGDVTTIEYYTKIIDTKKYDDKIEIISTVLYKMCLPADDYCYVSNRSRDAEDLNDLIDKISFDKEIDIDNYIDKLHTYRWVFKQNNLDYIFDMVEKIK